MGHYSIIWLFLCCVIAVIYASDPPVVYVFLGDKRTMIPDYQSLILEITARKNIVYLIAPPSNYRPSHKNIIVVDANRYAKSGNDVQIDFRHFGVDMTAPRKIYEMRCVKRWFVLRDFMAERSIDRVFHADGDTAVLVPVADIFSLRSSCDAVVSVMGSPNKYSAKASGHSSIWSFSALDEFTSFVRKVQGLGGQMRQGQKRPKGGRYRSVHADVLRKHNVGFSDMTLIWWWTVMHSSSEWDNGRPWRYQQVTDVQALFEGHDANVHRVRLLLKDEDPLDSRLRVCNGLDVVNRTVMDHMHGWCSDANRFSLALNSSNELPYTMGASLSYGGLPESTDKSIVRDMYKNAKLYFHTLHYQGTNKDSIITQDICRLLYKSDRYNNVALASERMFLCRGVPMDDNCIERQCLHFNTCF